MSGTFIPSLFSDNPQVINVAALYFVITPISYGTYGMVMVMNASFNGMGRPMPAVWISARPHGRLFYVPVAILLERSSGHDRYFHRLRHCQCRYRGGLLYGGRAVQCRSSATYLKLRVLPPKPPRQELPVTLCVGNTSACPVPRLAINRVNASHSP